MFDRNTLNKEQLNNVVEIEKLIGKSIEELSHRDRNADINGYWQIEKSYDAMTLARRRCLGISQDPKRYKERGIEFRFDGLDLPSFRLFMAEMGLPFERGVNCSIDRIDNNGHYEVGNIRWADSKTQANNK